MLNAELVAKTLENFSGEECNLTLVVILVIEKAVAANTMPSYTFNLGHLDGIIIIRWVAMMTEVVMAGRNVEMENFHWAKYHALPRLP
jgi:hypothetical protein